MDPGKTKKALDRARAAFHRASATKSCPVAVDHYGRGRRWFAAGSKGYKEHVPDWRKIHDQIQFALMDAHSKAYVAAVDTQEHLIERGCLKWDDVYLPKHSGRA